MSDGNPFYLPSSRTDGKQFDAKVVHSIFSFITQVQVKALFHDGN